MTPCVSSPLADGVAGREGLRETLKSVPCHSLETHKGLPSISLTPPAARTPAGPASAASTLRARALTGHRSSPLGVCAHHVSAGASLPPLKRSSLEEAVGASASTGERRLERASRTSQSSAGGRSGGSSSALTA
eukprot:scaffold235142_cov33-Tisochrysis_lutea.AAC.4